MQNLENLYTLSHCFIDKNNVFDTYSGTKNNVSFIHFCFVGFQTTLSYSPLSNQVGSGHIN